MHTFYQLGKIYAFPPLFLSPFNNFFPQPVIWPNFARPGGGVKQKNIHPCLQCIYSCILSLDRTLLHGFSQFFHVFFVFVFPKWFSYLFCRQPQESQPPPRQTVSTLPPNSIFVGPLNLNNSKKKTVPSVLPKNEEFQSTAADPREQAHHVHQPQPRHRQHQPMHQGTTADNIKQSLKTQQLST